MDPLPLTDDGYCGLKVVTKKGGGGGEKKNKGVRAVRKKGGWVEGCSVCS